MSEEMKKINAEELEGVAGGAGESVSGWKAVRVTKDTCLRRTASNASDDNVICSLHVGEYIRIKVDDVEGEWVTARVGHNEGVVDKLSVSYEDVLIAKTSRANRFGSANTVC